MIEKSTYGGQITWSEKLENFPAVTSVSGMEFADRLVEQVMERGADMELDEVSEIYALKSAEYGNKKYFVVKTVFGEEFKKQSRNFGYRRKASHAWFG